MDRNLLPAIAAFAEVARDGSFTRAAERLGISPSAASQTIRALEEKLDVRLLNRSTRSVSLTEDGRKLLGQVEPGLGMIAHAIGAVRDMPNRPAGDLRINSSRVAANHLIKPHLGEFALRHPLVRLELTIDDGFGDIIAEGHDAGIRLRESVLDSMIAVPISPPVAMAVVASPAYFAVNPPPETPHELDRHNCLGFRHGKSPSISPWEFTDPDSGEDLTWQPGGSFVTSGDEIMLSAALQGVGLVMHMEFAVRDHIASGALIRVLDAWCPPFEGFDLYIASREHMPAKLRALADFLAEKRRLMMSRGDG